MSAISKVRHCEITYKQRMGETVIIIIIIIIYNAKSYSKYNAQKHQVKN